MPHIHTWSGHINITTAADFLDATDSIELTSHQLGSAPPDPCSGHCFHLPCKSCRIICAGHDGINRASMTLHAVMGMARSQQVPARLLKANAPPCKVNHFWLQWPLPGRLAPQILPGPVFELQAAHFHPNGIFIRTLQH